MPLKQKLQQDFDWENDIKTFIQTTKSQRSKSFRSKLFQKKAFMPIPKIRGKEVNIHQVRYRQYRQSDLQNIGHLQMPTIWGCINPQPPKLQSPKRNYLKRNFDRPQEMYRSYLSRKSRLYQRTPLSKKVFQSQNTTPLLDLNSEHSEQKYEPEVTNFFTELQKYNRSSGVENKTRFMQTMKQKVKKYSEQKVFEQSHQKWYPSKSNQISGLSKFSQLLRRQDRFMRSNLIQRIDDKSIHQMSLQQLKQRIISKKRLLRCLNEEISGSQQFQSR